MKIKIGSVVKYGDLYGQVIAVTEHADGSLTYAVEQNGKEEPVTADVIEAVYREMPMRKKRGRKKATKKKATAKKRTKKDAPAKTAKAPTAKKPKAKKKKEVEPEIDLDDI